jgi:hypothetical protein
MKATPGGGDGVAATLVANAIHGDDVFNNKSAEAPRGLMRSSK